MYVVCDDIYMLFVHIHRFFKPQFQKHMALALSHSSVRLPPRVLDRRLRELVRLLKSVAAVIKKSPTYFHAVRPVLLLCHLYTTCS